MTDYCKVINYAAAVASHLRKKSCTSNIRFLSVSSCSSISAAAAVVGTRETDDETSAEEPALDSSRFALSSASKAAFLSAYGGTGTIAQQIGCSGLERPPLALNIYAPRNGNRQAKPFCPQRRRVG